jgi:TolB-like protein/cytochrome c-type biogenesis protein CcmH/NrfG
LAAAESLAQCPDGTPPPCAGRPAASSPTSVAVLPFANLSRDSSDAYLAEGLTEELISRLGAVPRLRVPGRSVVQRAQAAVPDPQALARRLGVRYLVEGSVRRGGARLRISVRLLRAVDGVRVWGDDYDRGQEDLLLVQETIAREVATNVAGQLLPGERATLTARPTRDPVAWDHFLRGNHAMGRRSARALSTALIEYETALAHDSGFAAAQARIAYVYSLGAFYGVEDVPHDSLIPRGERAADRALLLDPNSSDAWLAWGFLRTTGTAHGMPEARTAMERAVQLDPRNAEAFHQLGQVYTFLDDDSAAIVSYRRALAIEPGRAQTLYELGHVYLLLHRWRDALRLCDSAAVENPELARAYVGRARARTFLGEGARAAEDARRAIGLATGVSQREPRGALIAALAASGDTAGARAALAELEATLAADSTSRLRTTIATGLVALGQRERAIAVLRPIAASGLLSWLLRYPEFDPIRADPRFQRIQAAARGAP